MAKSEPQSVLSLRATLGEGPVWVERDRALWFVDIKQQHLHRFDPDRSMLSSWKAPGQAGWVLPTDDGLFAVGLQNGVHSFDPAKSSFTLFHDPEAHLPVNRLNDATVDADGRIWFGSMDDAEELDSGRIYRLYKGECAEVGAAPVCITNGPAVSADGGTLYHVDTLGKKIWNSRIDANYQLRDTVLFAAIEDGAGYPDGPTIDAEGCLWIGLFGGWGARRYDPDGTLMTHVEFPVANVTKIAFGGADLATAYATTACMGLSESDFRAQPLAGDLFAFDPGTRGLAGRIARMA